MTKASSSTATTIHNVLDHTVGVTSVPLGSTVDDSATVTGTAFGTPTGTVTFTWFTASSECTGSSTGAGTIPLVAGVAHPSTAFGPLAAGSYSFRATYSGDVNYDPSTGPCESLTVSKASSSTATTIHNVLDHTVGVTSVPLGSTVDDSATVTGTAFGAPTGNVTFTWFTASSECSGSSTGAGTIPLVAGCCASVDRVRSVGGGELFVPGDLQRRHELHGVDRSVRAAHRREGEHVDRDDDPQRDQPQRRCDVGAVGLDRGRLGDGVGLAASVRRRGR